MFARGLAICLTLGIVSSVHGAVNVVLTPVAGPGPYQPNSVQSVEVRLQQVPAGTAHLLRYVAFDMADNDPDLSVVLPTTHNLGDATPANDIKFWNFNTVAECPTPNDPDCGIGHLIDSDLLGSNPGLFSIAFYGNLITQNLGPDATRQINLPASAQVLIGRMEVGMPNTPGVCHTLNIVNADDTNKDRGAEVRYGFGIDVGDLITSVRGNGTAIALTGGTLQMCVAGVGTDLVSSIYACDASLPRIQKNTLRLTFSSSITLPPAGALEIRTISAGGAVGATNLAGSFITTVEGGNTLKLVENGDILANNTWYTVRYTDTGVDWPTMNAFKRDYAKVKGDADGSKVTNFFDLNVVFGGIGAATDTDRRDMDGSAVVNFFDINLAFGGVGSFGPAKPTGHTCLPVP